MPLAKHNLTRQDYEEAFEKELLSMNIPSENVGVNITNLWYNSMRSGGLRLTKRGFDILTKNLSLESWKLESDNMSINNLLVMLDKHLDSPYYIHPRRNAASDKEDYYYGVSIFSSKVAMAAGLMGLSHYLNMEEKRKGRK